jgi:alkylation response protein AidB-like acyl-CoA dehydrogenase
MDGMLEAQSDIRSQVAALIRLESPPSALRSIASSLTGFDTGMWDKAAQAGWFEMLVPDELGGLGLPLSDALLLFYEVGRSPVPGPLVDNVIAAAVVGARSRHGAGAALAPGAIVTLADPAAVVAADQGVRLDEHHRLTGTIRLVRFPEVCDSLLILLGAGDGGLVRLPAQCGGITFRNPVSLDAATRTAEVALTNVPLDSGDLLVGPEGGAELARELRADIRLAMAAETAGVCHSMVEMTAAYVAVRSQFGRTIGSFQAVQQIAAEMYELASRLCSLLDATLMDLSDADASGRAKIATRMSAAAASTGREVAEMALQLHGGIGYTSEHDLGLLYRRVLTLESQYGDRRARNSALGREVLAQGPAA